MYDPKVYAVVAIGAGLGGLLRYIIGLDFARRFGVGFPFATLFINLSGAFLIGVVVELTQTRAAQIPPLVRIGLASGFLGGYTTFSSFAYEMLALGTERTWSLSALYGLGSVVFGVAGCYAGMILTRLVTRSG
jgi:CrcB protein